MGAVFAMRLSLLGPGKLTLGLIIAEALILVGLLGLPPIGGSSEAREAQVIDIMYRTGEYVLPLRNGLVPSKPPLFHWTGLAVSKLFGGVTEWTVRIPSVIFALGVLGLLYGTANQLGRLKRVDNRDPDYVPYFAVLTTSLMYGFIHMGQRAMVDMCFAFFCWAAWYFGTRALVDAELRDPRYVRQWKTLFWASCGFAVLARGPIGVVVPPFLMVLGSVTVFGLKRALALWTSPTIGWVVCIAIFLPWYLLAFERGGDAFLDRQLFFENMQRFQGGDFVNEEPFWYYVPSLLRTAFPWSLLILGLLWKEARSGTLVRRKSRNFALIMALGGVLIFSIASGKRHSYMLPFFPFLGIVAGELISSWYLSLSDNGHQRLIRSLGVVLNLCLFLLLVFVALVALSDSPPISLTPLAWEVASWIRSHGAPIVVFAGAAALLVTFGSAFHTVPIRSLFACIGILSAGAVALSIGVGIKGRIKNFEQIASAISTQVPASEPLAVIKHVRDEFFDPILYYVHRSVELLPRDTENLECRKNTVALGAWFDQVGRQILLDRGYSVQEIARYNDLSDAARGNRDREMILFSCRETLSAMPGVV